MRWPFITRRAHERELAAANADRTRLRGERDQFEQERDAFRTAARTASRQFAEAREAAAAHLAAAVRTAGRNNRLTRSEAQHDANLDAMAARIDRALRGCVRYRAAHAAERRRADQLQARLDDATGLNSAGVADGRHWQATRQDKTREVKP